MALDTKIKSVIDNLDDWEKCTLVTMTMISLRGSWGDRQERCEILLYTVPLTTFEDKIKKAVIRDAKDWENPDFDGRCFRYLYEKSPFTTYSDETNYRTQRQVNEKVLQYTSDMSWEDI